VYCGVFLFTHVLNVIKVCDDSLKSTAAIVTKIGALLWCRHSSETISEKLINGTTFPLGGRGGFGYTQTKGKAERSCNRGSHFFVFLGLPLLTANEKTASSLIAINFATSPSLSK
jgi:hypothetical protein